MSVPSSKSSSREPESRKRPTRAMPTASQVDREGRAFCLDVGTEGAINETVSS